MAEIMWCENCRMRLGIDVDCDIAGHVHRPMRAVETGTDGRSKDGDDIVTRLRNIHLAQGDLSRLADEAAELIERLWSLGDQVLPHVRHERGCFLPGTEACWCGLSVWLHKWEEAQEARRG